LYRILPAGKRVFLGGISGKTIRISGVERLEPPDDRGGGPLPYSGFPCRYPGRGGVLPDLVQARIPGLPFGADTFKGIFCECVFSLVQEKSRSLEEFYRILQPGGHLVLSDLYIPEKYLSAVRQYQGDGPFTSCMAGAMGIIDLIRILENAGFTITLMEDHTRFLKQLAGQIVFEYGSLERFWDALPGAAGGGHLTHMCRSGSLKLGYGLFVATKYH
jgi:arsenite methyltransferase